MKIVKKWPENLCLFSIQIGSSCDLVFDVIFTSFDVDTKFQRQFSGLLLHWENVPWRDKKVEFFWWFYLKPFAFTWICQLIRVCHDQILLSVNEKDTFRNKFWWFFQLLMKYIMKLETGKWDKQDQKLTTNKRKFYRNCLKSGQYRKNAHFGIRTRWNA